MGEVAKLLKPKLSIESFHNLYSQLLFITKSDITQNRS